MKNHLYLLHGALGSAQSFKHVLPFLDQSSITALDFAGHGSRSAEELDFDLNAFANDLVKHIRLNATGPVDIFGYSMGGYVALIAARIAPERIGTIITYGTKFDWNPESSEREVRKLDVNFLKQKAPDFLKSLENQHGDQWEMVLLKTAKMMQALGERPAMNADQFQSIQHQIHLYRGALDRMVSEEETLQVHRLMTQSTFEELPDMPHQLDLIQGEEITKIIRKNL